MINNLCAAVSARVQALIAAKRHDAGEGPVPYIVMVVLIAGAAVLVAGIIYAFSNNYLDTNLKAVPNHN
jgi:capsular polysaccharide biosynthesis protein